MKSDLTHLPPNKQNELQRATEIIREATAPELTYRIEPEDLAWLEGHVNVFMDMVAREYRERIARFDLECG